MTLEQIQSIGTLLVTYHSDLTYIHKFHQFKESKISAENYLIQATGTFRSFINEFRVARNVEKDKTNSLLKLTFKWINTHDKNNVDDFAKFLYKNNITHGKIATSLTSKILFLNNPWEILPMDTFTRKAVGLKKNNYLDYLHLVEVFKNNDKNDIKLCLESVDRHLSIIEHDFTNKIENIKKIRENRFIDKFLWTKGQKPSAHG